MLSNQGIDTKFFERNAQLVTALLDERFDGEVSRMGLENFLGAFVDGDHWLLLMDMDGSLLPFKKARVRSSELRDATLPGTRLLIVENESCQHQLPALSQTIAVLGTGFDLAWLEGDWPSTNCYNGVVQLFSILQPADQLLQVRFGCCIERMKS